MVTHDSQAANHTERMLLLKDGKIIKEKQGLHMAMKNNKCPSCGAPIRRGDEVCPVCKKPIFATEEFSHIIVRFFMEPSQAPTPSDSPPTPPPNPTSNPEPTPASSAPFQTPSSSTKQKTKRLSALMILALLLSWLDRRRT